MNPAELIPTMEDLNPDEPQLLSIASGKIARSWLARLNALLVDAVDQGASIGFLAPLSPHEANDYWEDVIARLGHEQRLVLLIAGQRLLGSVQLSLCSRANGRHRAEVQKLFVHSSARGHGHGRRLMRAVEAEARAAGRSLLVLDTEAGSLAETVYRRLGWSHAGEIPAFAASPDGELRTTALYFKLLKLGAASEQQPSRRHMA
ncbi:GNAT family N-acetyltransferase [Roseateles microcysteis]|uniref:GNAT family N-acetyltransferase n=1 Tax=Roseateles microcysteis TaxID=3119057 RepID=UPI002FE5F87C